MADQIESGTSQSPPTILGTLALSVVLPATPSLALKPLAWYNRIVQFRAGIPLFLVHDFGHALRSIPGEEVRIGARKRSLSRAQTFSRDNEKSFDYSILNDYSDLLTRLSQTTLAQFVRKQSNSDIFIAGLLLHLFQSLYFQRVSHENSQPLPIKEDYFVDFEPAKLLTPVMARQTLETINYVVKQRHLLLIAVEQIDESSLKMLQMTSSEMHSEDYFLELLQVFSLPSAHDIARFSLDLLPSILETKQVKGSQNYAVDGYAAIDTRGGIESLLPTELVYDDEVFERRYLHREQLYYSREKDRNIKERLHYFIVDASASMRGLRTVFSRGVALAMAKKALLAGDEVVWRYFDSRLYDKKELRKDNMRIPYLLSFKGERGRNTTTVFTELHREIKRLGENPSQEIVITLFSHGRCVIRPEVILGLKSFAQLVGVFVLPENKDTDLEVISHFDAHHMVPLEILADRSQRQNKALDLIEHQEVGASRSLF